MRNAAGKKRSEITVKSKSRGYDAHLTRYVLEVLMAFTGAARFAIQVQIDDDDRGEVKQWTTWGEGTDPERWFQSWLRLARMAGRAAGRAQITWVRGARRSGCSLPSN